MTRVDGGGNTVRCLVARHDRFDDLFASQAQFLRNGQGRRNDSGPGMVSPESEAVLCLDRLGGDSVQEGGLMDPCLEPATEGSGGLRASERADIRNHSGDGIQLQGSVHVGNVVQDAGLGLLDDVSGKPVQGYAGTKGSESTRLVHEIPPDK